MSMPDVVFDADEQNFDRLVLEASKNRPVMVDFWADWCPPCRALTPVLEKLARGQHGGVLLAKVEADENMHLAGRYQLRGFPTVLLFVGGAEVGRFSGFKPEQTVRDFLAAHVPAEAEMPTGVTAPAL